MYHVFISDGRLYIHDDDGIREITSKFAAEKAEEADRQKELHSWKAEGGQESIYFSADILWGRQAQARPFRGFRFKAVMIKDSNTLYYILTNDFITGLFRYSVKDDEEVRLFHKRDFTELGMDYLTDTNEFVTAVVMEGGNVNIELLDSEGRYNQTLTSGDSRDCNPSFSKFNNRDVLYQTAGIARGKEGFVVAYGPEAIHKVRIDTGDITELLSDDKYDYLLPRDDMNGNLYCIRRPYLQPYYVSPLKMLINILTFPVRFVIAIVNFLNAFTKLFSEKPFTQIGPDIRPKIENKYINVLGRTIDLAKLQRSTKSIDRASLVPKSWELVKLSKEGQLETIAKKVSSFDIDTNGNVHFTNGFRVNELIEAQAKTVFRHRVIENIKVVSVTR
jgi:hypothetical protein